jgi:tetratricopeptide (TPR) repeat protein
MRWVVHLLVLLLAMPQVWAQGGALCDRAATDPDAGILACTQLIEHPSQGTNVAATYNNRGVGKAKKGYLDDAIADFTSALNQNPKFADAFKNRGLVYKSQRLPDKAIDDFNQAIQLDPKSPEFYNLRGAALLDKLEFNQAIADFNQAISLNQNYTNAYNNRGLAFAYTRQPSRALADFDKVVGLAPKDRNGYLNRAMVRMNMGNFTGAIADYDEAILIDPDRSGPYTRRGEAWRLQGDLQRALDDHNKAITLNPGDWEAYNNRALTFKDLGKFAEAIADCDQAILLNKNSEFAYTTRGLILLLQGNFWGSLTDLNKAVELKPNSPIALTFRGNTLREAGNLSGALEDFNKAISISPDFVAAYTGRGLTYEKKGELANAKADYEKALSLLADVDAGLARPSQAKARERLAALAEQETARAKAAADRADAVIRQTFSHAGAARPPLRILETGYARLGAVGEEKPGYGLYSYVLITSYSDKSAALLNEIFKVIPNVKNTAASPNQINILYIPFLKEKENEFSVATQSAHTLGGKYAESFYNFQMARAILDHLCNPPADVLRQLCGSDLSRGPFIFTYEKPASAFEPVPAPYLFVDLRDVHEHAFAEFVSAYQEQVKSDNVNEGERLNTLRLKFLNLTLNAADFFKPVPEALAVVIHSADLKPQDESK